jgi:hypothetical protein
LGVGGKADSLNPPGDQRIWVIQGKGAALVLAPTQYNEPIHEKFAHKGSVRLYD